MFGEKAISNASKLCEDGINCFAAGTEVITAINSDGTFTQTPIQNVYVGERILSRNQFDPSAPTEEQTVTAVEQHTAYSLQQVTIRGSDGASETITSTASHPFYVEGQGFTAAGGLVAGERIEDASGGFATVICSVSQNDPQGVTVHNFTVASDHTYFVDQGGDGVWVHNDCWSTARANYWKNAAHEQLSNWTGKYSNTNLARMFQGKAPQFLAMIEDADGNVLTKAISIELHHTSLFQRLGTELADEPWNLTQVTPWAHAAIDDYRYVNTTLLSIIKGINSF